MAILTDKEKQEIRKKAEVTSSKSGVPKEKEVELQVALAIIEKLLGKTWFRKACENNSKLPHNPSITYDFSRERIGPIAKWQMEYPYGNAKIIFFAVYLKELWEGNTNTQQKIAKYSEYREKNGDISFDHFKRLFFELQVATYFKWRGFDVYFSNEQKGKRMQSIPEFKLSSKQGTTYVECKKKDPKIKIDHDILNYCNYIKRQLFRKMDELRINYSINIKVDGEIKEPDVSLILDIINSAMEKHEKTFTRTIDNKTVEGRKLLDYNIVQSSRNLPKKLDYSNERFQLHSSYRLNYNNMFNIREMDIPVINFNQVAVYSSFQSTKWQSIKHSIEDASNQLSKPNGCGYGIIAIELSELYNANEQTDIEQLFKSLPELLKTIPHVSAILLFYTYNYVENDSTKIRSRIQWIVNNFASHKLPSDIQEATKKGRLEVPQKSLLDD